MGSIILVGAAAFKELRLEIGSLLIPIHVFPIILAMPLALRRLSTLRADFLRALTAFLIIFGAAVVRHGSEFGDLVKMIASVVTIVVVALLVRTRRDFTVGTIALTIATLAINARGFAGGFADYVGYEPLRGIANKNAYSIYALPSFLLAAFALFHFKLSFVARALHIGVLVSTTFILFTGANRSGWAGIAFILVMLAAQARRWRVVLGIVMVSLLSYGVLQLVGDTSTFEYRVQQTTSGYESDELRGNIVEVAIEIALENPILGLTPQELPFELAKRTATHGEQLDPHNFIAYILGGCGFLTAIALALTLVGLWRRPRVKTPTVLMAHDLVRMVVLLFVVRGLFSREVFFVAAFPVALGLALGLMQAEEQSARNPAQT